MAPAADARHLARLRSDEMLMPNKHNPDTETLHAIDMANADLAGILFDDAHHVLEPALLTLAGLVEQHADIRRRLGILDAAHKPRMPL